MARGDRTAIAWLITASVMLGGAVYFAGPAHADGYISTDESDYIELYGQGAICPVIDRHHSIPGVMGVMAGIVNDGFAEDDAVDIINASVDNYCPRNWPLLVAIGKAARAETGATL